MDSKEATSYRQSETETSTGSLSSSSQSRYSFDNDENTVALNNIAQGNSRSDNKDCVSDGEGYLSGEEEFEMALDKPILVGNLEEESGEGNSDGPFVDAPATVEPLPNGVVMNDDDDVGNGVVPPKHSVGVSAAVDGSVDDDFVGDNEIIGSVGKLDVNSIDCGGGVVDANATNSVESLTIGDKVSEAEQKEESKAVEPSETGLVDNVDAELTPEGDSVVDTIQAVVSGPGVVVVGETNEKESLTNGDEVSETETKGDDAAVEVEPRETAMLDIADAEITAEWDSVVDTVQVDVAGSGVVVVGETDEKVESLAIDDLASETDKKEEVTAVEPRELPLMDTVDGKITPQGDSVVDSIQVDVAAPGLVFVGEKNTDDGVQNDRVKEDVGVVAIVEQEKLEESRASDVKLTEEGDSIVDSIQVESVAPGVAVVGELEEKDGDKIAHEVLIDSVGGVDESSISAEEAFGNVEVALHHQRSEPSVENTGDIVEPSSQPENHVDGDEKLDAGAVVDSVNEVHPSTGSADTVEVEKSLEKTEGENEPVVVAIEAFENGITSEIQTAGEVEIVDRTVGLDSNAGIVQSNGDYSGADLNPEDSLSDGDADDLVFGSEAAKRFIEDLEQEGMDSHTGAGSSLEQSQRIDGQIVTDSEEEEGDTDDEGDGKELFDSAALAALVKAATGADSDGGGITITSQDGSRLFSVERPVGLGSSLQALRPAPRASRPTLFGPSALSAGVESEENLSEEDRKKLVKLQEIRVKFLRLVHRLGLSPEESVAAQVLYRLALLGGRQSIPSFNLDAAKQMALQLESEDGNDLDFSVNILVIGKSGVGKSATINSIFGDQKSFIDAFETGTASVKQISGCIDGVKVHVVDTPGLKSSAMEQGFNRSVFSSVQKKTKKNPIDVVLYVDRLDAQTRDLNDLPLLKTVTSAFGPSIWRSAIVTLTHGSSAPPDGPSGAPLSYDVFVSQRSHVVQQSIGHAVGDLRMMSPSLMNPVTLVENHRDCRKNREGEKILPNGQSWRPQLLLLCYSMKILSEASSLSKPQDPFDQRKLFGFRSRSAPLPYMLSSMLQSRAHPKLASDQGGDSVDSDIDLDDFSDSDHEEEEEYDQLPPFRPLKSAQLSKLSKEQKKAYFEEYDYRVKLLQKKQWREELRRMREIKRRGNKDAVIPDYGFPDEDSDSGGAAPVAVPLPDMALPPSFDGDNPAYRYRFLEPTSQFLARPVLDSHGWDHDCGYDGVNLEHNLAIISRFPAAYTIQITKDKKDFTVSLDSSISAKHGDKMSSMAGFDIQSMGKQLAYIFRGETKFKNLRKNKAAAGISFTVLGENVIPGAKIEDQIILGKRYVLVGSAGAVKSQQDTAYGANFELQRKDSDYPIGQVQSTVSMSLVKWRGDLALGFNGLAQLSVGRNSKVAVRAGINNKMNGQLTVRTSSSDNLSLALPVIIPTVLAIYKKLWPSPNDKYSIY